MKNKSHIKKGFFIACIFIVFNIFRHFSHTYFNEWTSFVSWGILVFGVLLSVSLHNTEINKQSSFSYLFGYGFKTTAVATCLIIIYMALAVYIVFPDFSTQLINQTIEQAKKANPNNNLPQTQLEMAQKVMKIGHISMTLMGTLFLGLIGSLLGAVTAKKNPPQLN